MKRGYAWLGLGLIFGAVAGAPIIGGLVGSGLAVATGDGDAPKSGPGPG